MALASAGVALQRAANASGNVMASVAGIFVRESAPPGMDPTDDSEKENSLSAALYSLVAAAPALRAKPPPHTRLTNKKVLIAMDLDAGAPPRDEYDEQRDTAAGDKDSVDAILNGGGAAGGLHLVVVGGGHVQVEEAQEALPCTVQGRPSRQRA